jgi:hypothetical protein
MIKTKIVRQPLITKYLRRRTRGADRMINYAAKRYHKIPSTCKNHAICVFIY